MKKIIISIVAALTLSLQLSAQTNSTPPAETNLSTSVTGTWNTVVDFLANGSNWLLVPFGIYSDQKPKAQFGGGVALAYKVSDYIAPTLRVDYLAGDLWMPSGTVQLQVPIHLSPTLTLYPFAFAGVGTSLSGGGNKNGEANAIAGMGAALALSKKFDLIFDYEKWSAFSGNQWRFGCLFRL